MSARCSESRSSTRAAGITPDTAQALEVHSPSTRATIPTIRRECWRRWPHRQREAGDLNRAADVLDRAKRIARTITARIV